VTLAGDGGSDEAKNTKEDAEMGVCGVHMACEAVEWRAWWTCIHVYRVRGAKVLMHSWVVCDRCADGDTPGWEQNDVCDEGERERRY
jgi:hypothetical protein